MPNLSRVVAAILAASLTAACAATGDEYPSLSIRDVERAQGQFAPVAVPQLDVPPVETDGIPTPASALAAARDSDAAFQAALPATRRAVAAGRGAGRESDARASALVAIAVLESRRSDTAIALGHLDTLLVADRIEADPDPDVVAAQAQVLAIVEAQDAALDPLRAQLR